MHPLLTRQLKRFLGATPVEPGGPLELLLRAVSDAYVAGDEERALLDHTITEASNELEERNAALLLDIARRDRAEGERDGLFRTSTDLLCILDERMHFSQTSPSWERVMGYQPGALLGKSVLALAHPDDREAAMAEWAPLTNLTGGQVQGLERRVRAHDGTWRWISWAGTHDPQRHLIFAIGRDVTVQRELDKERVQAHKLEAVGSLASGVAHEINTPVQFIGDNLGFVAESMNDLLSYLETVEGELTDAQRSKLAPAAKKADLDYLRVEVPKSLSESKAGVRRVAELVRALKEFAHPDRAEMEPADLNHAIERALVLARGELKHVARVDTSFGPLEALDCHVGGLSQVFLNLVVNAAHAIEEREARQPGPEWERVIAVKTWQAGAEVFVSIRDTGCGIPPALLERIYEPFFTTKPVGKGSGQGLPLVRNVVVNQHHGKVELESTVGVGTTFTLRLPVHATRQVQGRAA
jgi:two-component system, NtrC family, sensor kinase